MQPFGCLSRTKFIAGACPLLAFRNVRFQAQSGRQ
jgi:hypothetical protein